MDQHYSKERSTVEETSPSPPPSEGRGFTHLRQVISLFFKFLGRWLLTAAICAAFAVVLKEYDKRVYIQDDDTHVYNAITAGLTICLSLNIDSSLNALANTFKWVIIAYQPFPPRIVSLILGFDSSKLNVIRLLFWPKSVAWWLRLICFVWLLIAIAAQVGTALIGLTYSVVPLLPDSGDFPRLFGDGSTAIFTQIGAFSVDRMQFPTEPEPSLYNLTVQRSNAFAYGVGAINSPVYDINGPWAYSFHSATFDFNARTFTNPIANYPTWTKNIQWNAIGRYVLNWASCADVTINDLTYYTDTTTINFIGYNGTQEFDISQSPLDYMTYISDTSFACGPRCTQVYAIVTGSSTTNMFVCNSTVGEMYDVGTEALVTQENLTMPDTQARILGGAIGWGDIDVNGTVGNRNMPGRFLASSFPYGSYWTSPAIPNAEGVSDELVAHFTAATIEVINQYGVGSNFTNLNIPGVASELDVKWMYSVLILALIPGLQALLAVICMAIVYRHQVPVHDDSPFASATLLGPIVSHIPRGVVQSESQIAKSMRDSLVYMPAGDGHGSEVKLENPGVWNLEKAFRHGQYH
ncbi:hypothetical protein F4677DRAFT_407436 [Hypoxylon crocopeplum]|nr:hypothetical protein F4677DRAFT_407436 [Hypoxylon crocopeplum]